MKAISGKELARLLEQRGWQCIRIRGSHHVYGKSGSNVRLSVPIHGKVSLKQGLARFLLKNAGISPDEISGQSHLKSS